MPRNYTQGLTTRWNNPWTEPQKLLLEQLVTAKRPWHLIAERTGHPRMSCQSMMSYIRRGRKRPPSEGGGRINPPMRMQAPLPQIAAIVEASSKPCPRRRSTETLIADAELRARIETLGVTGGLFGDPLPGRSALDRKKEGALT